MGQRQTYFTSIITSFLGITPNINLGFDLYFKSVRFDDTGSSPFQALSFGSGDLSRTALASFAPKIKFTPFTNRPSFGRWQSLAFQQTFLFPLSNDMEGQVSGGPFLSYDDWESWTQLFYDWSLSPSWLIYFEGGYFFRFDSNPSTPRHEHSFPFKAFLNYYPTQRFTIYGSSEAVYFNQSGSHAYYTQFGVGFKFQVAPGFELETLGTSFPFGRNKGAGVTYNVGFRLIR